MLKDGKDPKDVKSYRPVALSNTLWKIFERMTNKILVWYLENEKKYMIDSSASEDKETQ